ncbi:HD domain-containing protein [Ferrovibrio sp.]|uniref:HD domain-containing protein n=1 Tax=Ferrovibrio sp. TaxID=1917215 RepID=UPI0035162528
MYKPQRILDPLHKLIEFRAEELDNAMWDVIQTPPFQRLRRVKQLGFSDFVYPGATHSRFAHSVGVFHTARQLVDVIDQRLAVSKDGSPHKKNVALAASLVHDVGHGPFSHAFEDVGKRLKLKMAHHEHVSVALIRESEISDVLKKNLGLGFAEEVANVIGGESAENIYNAVVSSQFDADRLDYMRRDRLMAGTQTGAIDFDWLLANLEVGDVPYGVDDTPVGNRKTFVLGSKAIHAAETFVLALFQLYPTLYLHKATRGAEKIFSELIYQTILFSMNDAVDRTGLPEVHPIIKFAKNPDSLENALALDDTVIWGALSLMATAKDEGISEFSRRLRDRQLYKCVDARERIEAALLEGNPDLQADRKTLGSTVDAVCSEIFLKVDVWNEESQSNKKRILKDMTSRVPYKRVEESKGPLNQIRIRVAEQSSVDIVEKSHVVAAIEPFKVFRLYAANNDDAARKYIDDVIRSGVEHGKSNL